VANHETVERELQLHDPRLAGLPRILALSKADLVDPDTAAAAREAWAARLGPDTPILLTSSVTRAGLEELAIELVRRVPLERSDQAAAGGAHVPLADLAEHRVFRPTPDRAYRVQQIDAGSFRVTGAGIERLVARYDLENDDALAHLERRLRGIGVIRALEAEGFQAGDDVEIAGVQFELDPGV